MGKIVLVIISSITVLALFVVFVSTAANYQFNKSVNNEVAEFYRDVDNCHEVIQERDLQGLPLPVQNWLRYSQIIGKEKIVAAHTKQEVSMRLKQDQSWMSADVEQYFRTDEPGFIWTVKIKAAPFFHIVGRDKYIDGHGNMMIKLLSFITIADAKGKEIDQGTLLRYLAEIMWSPTAALSDYIKWEAIDSKSVKATMSYQGVSASGVFTFNEKGEIVNFEAERYGEFGGEYRLETWSVDIRDYKKFNHFIIPSEGELVWKLKTGDFEWYQFELKEMEYNKPEVYKS